jgi:hypothetical protein
LYETNTIGYYFQRPGKTGYQCSATYGRTGPCLYVFSGNAQPFAANTAYSPFAALALLEHDGDFAQAAKTLTLLYPPTPEEREQRRQWRTETWHRRAKPWAGQWHSMTTEEAPPWRTMTTEEAPPWHSKA